MGLVEAQLKLKALSSPALSNNVFPPFSPSIASRLSSSSRRHESGRAQMAVDGLRSLAIYLVIAVLTAASFLIQRSAAVAEEPAPSPTAAASALSLPLAAAAIASSAVALLLGSHRR
ncbi:hypothetical protein Cni_G07299 [Canna indica]|uniref:Uncharacterized protein n=1 Tax=Canna indica TaxID=4628 RepID=A0AAQ3Q786_9LILI|nr:hypothetical protein Cni_G07299 [Canna indica]